MGIRSVKNPERLDKTVIKHPWNDVDIEGIAEGGENCLTLVKKFPAK